jgi:hypothetical protein
MLSGLDSSNPRAKCPLSRLFRITFANESRAVQATGFESRYALRNGNAGSKKTTPNQVINDEAWNPCLP